MSSYSIHVQIEEACAGEVRPGLFRQAARAALHQQSIPGPATLSILLTGDEALQDLNRRWLDQDEPTDVLSFPAEPTADRRWQTAVGGQRSAVYLGDIAISLPRAAFQAQVAGHSLSAELRLLTVHGVLHLLGHDHARADEQARMWHAQKEILAALEVPE